MPQPFRMVSLWMENGNIVSFLRDNGEKNPFQLVSTRHLLILPADW